MESQFYFILLHTCGRRKLQKVNIVVKLYTDDRQKQLVGCRRGAGRVHNDQIDMKLQQSAVNCRAH